MITPPQLQKWEEGHCRTISQEDRHPVEQSGMESKLGMKCYDTIQVLNHLITLNAPSKSLGTFLWTGLGKVKPGFIRIWSDNQWFQKPPVFGRMAHVTQHRLAIMQLLEPRRLLDLDQLNVTCDSTSWDVAAEHCLQMHMGVMEVDEGDSFHDSCNCTTRAMFSSKVVYAAWQTWHHHNCDWMPLGQAFHKVKKKEGMKEQFALYASLPQEWEEEATAIASNAGVACPAPATELSSHLMQHFKDGFSWLLQGMLYRLTTWLSIVP